MLKLYTWLKDLLQSERGQDMVEYALITAVISIAVVIAAIGILSPAFDSWAQAVADCITSPAVSTCPFPV